MQHLVQNLGQLVDYTFYRLLDGRMSTDFHIWVSPKLHLANMLATSPTDETPTSCTKCPYPVKLLYNILLICVIHTGSKLGLGLALWAEKPFGQQGIPEPVVKAVATGATDLAV